ncbi:hypothetical protein AGLY_013256 [Aphis glycines]|uniref:Uncharacterized protein n=1 Tax=Aphis glycines TaxID=307491 RepID=A0A6G0T5S5_APHGL|nr:hypothetical protein AGLY_013256 [Aphis glycines]
MEDNSKQINNSIASGRSDSTEVTEKDFLLDVQIKKPELVSLKCRELEKMYSDIIENDSEVQPSESTVDIKIEEPKAEEAKQIFSDVSPDDYTRELVLSGLTDELLVAANRRSLNLPPVSLFSSDDELLSSFSDRSTTESSEVSKPKSYTSVLEKLLEFEEISMEIRNPSLKTGKHLPPIPLCLQEDVPIREIGAVMSLTEIESNENNIVNRNVPSISDNLKNVQGQESLCVLVDVLDIDTDVYDDSVPISEIGAVMSLTEIDSDENNVENINMPPISEDLKNAEGQESLCMPVDVLDIETIIHNDSVGSGVIEPEKSTARQPRLKRRFLSALGRGLLKVSRSLCCWRCK